MLRSRAISKTKLIIWIIRIILIIILPIILFWTFQYFSKAAPTKANIVVDARAIVEPIIPNWKNLAQGGEEKGVRMLEGVISDIAGLYPRYIRLDHIYDYYDVVSRNHNNQLVFDWSRLDQTICDIYHAGARPFLVLGYMPPAISKDGSLISPPNDWSQWRLLVKKTIERYSGKNSRLCGGVTGEWFNHIYYEVWNEPDLETFGQWSLYKEERSYLKLYENTVKAAEEAENVHQFYIGGPVTTALYRNWILKFLDYIITKNLRLDFISWHHYTSEVDEYLDDINKLNSWLMTDKKYEKYRFRQKIISEWGYDSNPNPIADTSVGAAHTVAAIINLLKQKVNLAFSFEIKDGPQPSWGVLSYDGRRKPRYYALKMLNEIGDKQLSLIGEGTYVRGVASYQDNTIKLILVNYDKRNSNTELVPVRFYNLAPGIYDYKQIDMQGRISQTIDRVEQGELIKQILMPPNAVLLIELIKR